MVRTPQKKNSPRKHDFHFGFSKQTASLKSLKPSKSFHEHKGSTGADGLATGPWQNVATICKETRIDTVFHAISNIVMTKS